MGRVEDEGCREVVSGKGSSKSVLVRSMEDDRGGEDGIECLREEIDEH